MDEKMEDEKPAPKFEKEEVKMDAKKEEVLAENVETTADPQTKRKPAVFYNIRGNKSTDVGQFKAEGDLFGWKSKMAKGIVQYEVPHVTNASFCKTTPKDWQLRFEFKDGSCAIFDGFKESDFETVKNHFGKEGLSVEKFSICTRGRHWGEYEIENTALAVKIDGKAAFKLRGKDIFQVDVPSKTDVSFGFNPSGVSKEEDRLVEIRVHVPLAPGAEGNPAEEIRERMLEVTGANAAVDSVLSVSDVRVLVPNGRFDFLFLKNVMKLHGKSSDFPIRYSTISKMYLLPDSLSSKYNLVLSLDLPIRKGQTRYNNLIVQLDDKKVSWTLNVEEEKLKKFAGKGQEPLTNPLEGPEYSMFCVLLKALTGKPMQEPTPEFIIGPDRVFVKCTYKTESGYLYAMAKSFLYVIKPVIHVRFDEITHIEFGNLTGTQTKLFEFRIGLKSGSSYEFNSVDRADYQSFVEFLQNKGIKIRNTVQQMQAEAMATIGGSEEDESDEDYEANASESSESGDEDDDEGSDAESPGKSPEKSPTKKSKKKQTDESPDKSSEKSSEKSSDKKKKKKRVSEISEE